MAGATSCRKSKIVGSQLTGSNSISESLTYISKIPIQRLYPYVFGVKLSGSDIFDFVERRCVLEIQDGSQITGSTNNFAGFTDRPTHVVPNKY